MLVKSMQNLKVDHNMAECQQKQFIKTFAQIKVIIKTAVNLKKSVLTKFLKLTEVLSVCVYVRWGWGLSGTVPFLCSVSSLSLNQNASTVVSRNSPIQNTVGWIQHKGCVMTQGPLYQVFANPEEKHPEVWARPSVAAQPGESGGCSGEGEGAKIVHFLPSAEFSS